ncbi:MAG: cytochrome C [Deltaproteobacteria bacterium]|nr:MAG: cytochrome C [Deltaproteobacteria bacterium]
MKIFCRGLCLLAAAFAVGVILTNSTSFASIADSECIECHDEFELDDYNASAHGQNACNSCHYDVIDIGVHEDCGSVTQEKVETCHRCHPEEGREHFASVHMYNDVKCSDCHSNIHTDPKWDGNKQTVVDICVGCHDGDDYQASVHGVAVAEGNADAPDCSDCHGLHRIEAIGDANTPASRAFHTASCHKCHADVEMMARNDVPEVAVLTYEESYHGKVASLGSGLAAGCADCHSGHGILSQSNPDSTISPDNLPGTCGTCHPGSSINFAQFYAHSDYHDQDKFPVLYWTYMLMTVLLIGVFAVFWIHTFLWWYRAYWDTHSNGHENWECIHREVPEALRPYRRFSAFDKILHILMAVSFLGLVVTGAPLKFNSAPWAHALMDLMGGPHAAGYVHRICAVITFVYFGLCCAYVFYFLLLKRDGSTFFQRLFGPDSLFPNLRDVKDFKAMVAWFFGRGKEPTFERWTYWEKFDFLAVFWGMFAIGGSGLLLWFPEFFGKFMPGWIFNVAIIVHSDEALLASGFIFTVHFFNTHFRPGKFPMDMVIFRGWVPKYELMHERADWAKRLEAEGRLESYKTKPSHPLSDLISQIFGFLALGIGLLCIILIIWGFLAH